MTSCVGKQCSQELHLQTFEKNALDEVETMFEKAMWRVSGKDKKARRKALKTHQKHKSIVKKNKDKGKKEKKKLKKDKENAKKKKRDGLLKKKKDKKWKAKLSKSEKIKA